MKFSIRKIINLIYIIFIISVLLVIFFAKPSKNTNSLDFENTIKIKEAVFIQNNDDSAKYNHISMPSIINTKDSFELHIDLSDIGDLTDKSFAIQSAYMDFSAHMDGLTIYVQNADKNKIIKSSGGLASYVTNFPINIKKPTLTIKFTPKLKYSTKYILYPITIGYRTNFIAPVFVYEDLLIMFVSITLVIVGILFLISSIVLYKNSIVSKKYVNLFFITFFSVIYAFTSYKGTNYILSEYRIFIYFIKYLSIFMIPYPILRLFEDVLDKKYRKISFLLVNLTMLNCIIQIFLTLKNIIEFEEMMSVTFVLITLIIFIQCILVILSKNSDEKRELLISLLPIIIIYSLSMIIYILFGVINNIFVLLTAILFICTQIYFTIKNHMELITKNEKSNKYKQLIEQDTLTSLGSRYAFENYMNYIENSRINASIISADLNNLKNVNDNLGHSYGDILIKEAGEFLKNNIDNANVYRTGGDEYVVICEYILSEEEFENIRNAKFYVKNISEKIDVSLSMGMCYYYGSSGKSIYDVFSIADANMYENKNKYKKERGLILD